MNFHLTTSYYCIVILLFSGLLFTVVRVSRGEQNFRLTACFTVLVIGANISLAIAFSWFVDPQPQGRYLFPSLLAIGWMLSRLRNWQSSRIVFALVVILAILGMYAFICYGVIPLKEHVPSNFL
jgi:sulfite exporter TauE/SafE